MNGIVEIAGRNGAHSPAPKARQALLTLCTHCCDELEAVGGAEGVAGWWRQWNAPNKAIAVAHNLMAVLR